MITISKEQYASISRAVKDYSGIVLERIPRQRVEKKIKDQMVAFNCLDLSAYIGLLNDCKANPYIMDSLISEVTVSESYIFRNPKQFEYMLARFFPDYFEKNDCKFPLKIWSAGCSRGEEPYSIAMIAMDYQKKHPEAGFTINAGDISKYNLNAAKSGVYTASSMRGKIEYFEEKLGFKIGEYDAKGNCRIFQEIKDMVNFQWLNLKDIGKLKIMQGSDIIFCRNVLVYFDEVLRNKLLETFFACLNSNGLLFIGESECFPFPDKTFELLNTTGSYAYRKP